MYDLNRRFGRKTLTFGAAGIGWRTFDTKRAMTSLAWTTRIDELPVARYRQATERQSWHSDLGEPIGGVMSAQTYAPFAFASIALLLTPGPTNTILAASSAAMGLRRAWMLPLAEAAGYVIAVFAFVRASEYLADVPIALPAMKAIAAVWLLYSAYKLWTQPIDQRVSKVGEAIKRVFLTTLLNPKAMLVGTIIIPTALPAQQMTGVLLFPCLSVAAGALWMTIGSAIPDRLRPYAYKGAACIIGMFSFAAVSSAAHLI